MIKGCAFLAAKTFHVSAHKQMPSLEALLSYNNGIKSFLLTNGQINQNISLQLLQSFTQLRYATVNESAGIVL